MTPRLVNLLRDPETGEDLSLTAARQDSRGQIISGTLVSASGRAYPIREGIARFAAGGALQQTVHSFGDQWNRFNFIEFKRHWLNHTVKNTFETTDAFRGKLIVDAGAGSGAQALWMLESGARHVILLELSHSVDDVVRRNLESSPFRNWDIIQCSIDAPPLKPGSIDGIVICHNVIQHTPSVERTAHALFDLVAPGGEFVFNCYPKNDQGLLRKARFHLVYRPLRAVLSRMPFGVNYAYASTMAALRLIPALGSLLEKSGFCVRGEVLSGDGRRGLRHHFRAARLNTFDAFGSHQFQHLKTDAELRALVRSLQPDPQKIQNMDRYFQRPAPIGCALRIAR